VTEIIPCNLKKFSFYPGGMGMRGENRGKEMEASPLKTRVSGLPEGGPVCQPLLQTKNAYQ